jgi:NAD-dependent dihydropyrimidine dehydrogenase PreA subunit
VTECQVPEGLSPAETDAVLATADLVGRTGAQSLQIAYVHDDVPNEAAGWYAYAQYPGARVTVDGQPGPVQAAEKLAARLLGGGLCVGCKRIVSVRPDGGVPIGHQLQDGRVVDKALVRELGTCQWRRYGQRWEAACKPHPALAELPEDTPTTERLAVVLEADGAPAAMVEAARAGYYDDYRSELLMPIAQLGVDAVAAGLLAVADRAKRGEFDGTKAESDAWAASPEGQAAFREFVTSLGGDGSTADPTGSSPSAGNREERRRQQRRSKGGGGTRKR